MWVRLGPPIPFQTKFLFSFLYIFPFLRYIGSMVADVHRTLKYGGIFMYPATGFLFKFKYSNIPIFALPSIKPQWQTASALRVHAHGLHYRTSGGHCQHWTVSSNKKLFQLTKARVAELGSLSSGAKMAMKIFVKRVFTIFKSNASFLRVIANLQN